jgi:alkylated DNA repair dioxygenase AlkB
MFDQEIVLTDQSMVSHVPAFIDTQAGDALFENLDTSLRFSRPLISMFGRRHQLPRDVAWIAEDNREYGYSGISTKPIAWPLFLLPVRRLVEQAANSTFNSVLVNRYVDGSDCVAWHSDDEPELGANPVVASLSLGATRRFLMRNKITKEKTAFELAHGDLLVMRGACQAEFEHCVPRTKRVSGSRINLTFRNVLAPTRYEA